jgi:hypothetical protein
MFTLQLGHPKINTLAAAEYPSVEHALQAAFRHPEEAVFFYWNDIPVRMRYRHDIVPGADALLAMCWYLEQEKSGKTKVEFSTHLAEVRWVLSWEGDTLTVEAEFLAHDPLYASYAESLNRTPVLRLSKHDFLSEWNTMLRQLRTVFEAAPFTVKDGTERRKLELLQRTETSIRDYGRLYTR